MKNVGISSHGFTTATTIMIPNSAKPICKQSTNAEGSSSSMAPISLENLFNILPELFVLKNLMVACVILVNMALCSLVEAFMQTMKKTKERMRVMMIVAPVIPE